MSLNVVFLVTHEQRKINVQFYRATNPRSRARLDIHDLRIP
jgi:hypothetical protein